MRRVIEFTSCEWMLHYSPNGGTVVFLRTLCIATGLFVIAIAVKDLLRVDSELTFDLARARALAEAHLTWYGAIFAATYAALYARFSAQWAYLANLYNQIMASTHQRPRGTAEHDLVLDRWWAAFMEDAIELHLARKPMFALALSALLQRDSVRKEFLDGAHRGNHKLLKLAKDLHCIDAALVSEALLTKITEEAGTHPPK